VAVAETVGDNYGPLTMNFDGSRSRDPDADTPLTYVWDFGDGSAPQETTTPSTDHNYSTAGRYTVTLTVRDSLGKESDPDTVEVFPGDTPPEPVIETPTEGTTFRVGQPFTATASVTDAEDDGDGDATSTPTLEWDVLRHHDGNHTHPWGSGPGGQLEFSGPAPEGLYSTDPQKNYLEIRLTATDSQGLSRTVTREIRPRVVNVSFETDPLNFRLRINGTVRKAPRDLTSWEGYVLNVDAMRQKDRRGRLWAFKSWSDGATKERVIETPPDPKTYTAIFYRIRR
ncbi:MAG TPA: PKD domain-containing protein, partial [Rubrobacter sp.]|nr:PKD domain-containing protein [Rubrobacter sp.]